MAYQYSVTAGTQGLMQCVDIGGQCTCLITVVRCNRSRGVATGEWRNSAIACLGQFRQQEAPGVRRVWKAMNTQSQRPRPTLKEREINTVGLDLIQMDVVCHVANLDECKYGLISSLLISWGNSRNFALKQLEGVAKINFTGILFRQIQGFNRAQTFANEHRAFFRIKRAITGKHHVVRPEKI